MSAVPNALLGVISVKKWIESKGPAPKDQCPAGYRGEYPDVLRRLISGLKRLDLRTRGLI